MRDNGNRIDFSNGNRIWYRGYQKHRIDGPAVVYWPSGNVEFWLDGSRYNIEDYLKSPLAQLSDRQMTMLLLLTSEQL
jgi:hypothetical protein